MSERPRWYPAYVGLGSNLNRPTRQIETALELLGDISRTRLVSVSSLYRSAPFGGIEQPDFVNAVAALLTQLGPAELLSELKNIEARQGRERDDQRWGPRVLDLDLLVHAAAVIDEPGLTVPHPGIGERNFVLLPLVEVAPELVIPGIGRAAALPVTWDEPSISLIV
jgi:2-amino-4-hydroxy-6-hydroxymethyldihydropteridine diphosphokinase